MDDIINAIHSVIRGRIQDPNAYYYPLLWWEKEINILTSDLNACIRFISSEASDEEMSWLSEIYEDLIDKTQSAELLQCIHDRVERIQDTKERANLITWVEDAAAYLRT